MKSLSLVSMTLLASAALAATTPARAQLFVSYAPQAEQQIEQQQQQLDMIDEQAPAAEQQPPELKRQLVDYRGKEAPGTIIIDTPNKFLYYVVGDGKAMRYGIGVGREGFTWSGTHKIERKAEWPDWYPPQEMIARQPYLPRMTAGGPGNPLGARAMYIGGTMYRIHGTNDPSTIGKNVSSGCIRLTNEDVIDLYSRVQVGSKVVVLPDTHMAKAARDSLSYAPPRDSRAANLWANIGQHGLY
jgi:lipoprotein-anchoring transpeptidase ErfK/SrfK